MEYKDTQNNQSKKKEKNLPQKTLLEELRNEIQKTEPEKVSFLKRALLSAELIKEGLEKDLINPIDADNFANSLIEWNTVPVIIGTSKKPIFSIKTIIQARPNIIENYRKHARKNGLDLKEGSKWRKEKAQKIADLLEMGNDWLEKKYGPFQLSPKDKMLEVIKIAKQNEAVREMLGKEEEIKNSSKGTREEVNSFMELNFANFIVGQSLKKFLKDNYTLL